MPAQCYITYPTILWVVRRICKPRPTNSSTSRRAILVIGGAHGLGLGLTHGTGGARCQHRVADVFDAKRFKSGSLKEEGTQVAPLDVADEQREAIILPDDI